jgi:formylglycine-generating enzyme required for sulfatase activity
VSRIELPSTAELNVLKIIAQRDGYVFTAPAGRFKPNPWGVHDLFGNAWEWTEDCFGRSYEGAPVDGSARQAAAGRGQVPK